MAHRSAGALSTPCSRVPSLTLDLNLQLIFIGPDVKGGLESLSVPLLSILSTAFEQPMFGANYLAFDIKPSPEGGLSDGTKAEIRLKDKGIFEFVGAVEKTRERAIYMKRQKAEEEEEDGLRASVYCCCFPG